MVVDRRINLDGGINDDNSNAMDEEFNISVDTQQVILEMNLCRQ